MAAGLTFSAWLRLRRRQLDLTQQELADRSSCSVVTIRKIEQGDRRPSKQLAESMAAALQIPGEHAADFVTYARQDPDSTEMPDALQGLGQIAASTVNDTSADPHPSEQTDDARVYVLPRPTTPFLGREAEIQALLDYLLQPQQQLVSILGPGGMGKTRLALAVAHRLAAGEDHPFSDGVVFVSLAALTEATEIAPAVSDALRILVDGRRGVTEQLLAYLSQRNFLLVIDNCEHLLDGIGLLVEIVQAAPGVTVLATSRERLHLQGEQAYPIDGLGALDPLDPDSGAAMEHPAVGLFRQSAQRAAPTFALTPDDLPQVARICRLVDGMPLGIELSAGWVGMMSLADIAAEVQRNLDFLASDFRNLPARHRSMRAVFDASWQHLDPVEQAVFRQLSVFRGGFTRQAAADVAGASLRHLGHLIYKSLLHYDRAHNRYWLHELLHQYGADRLATDPAEMSSASANHCDYFIGRLIACAALLKGDDQAGALAELDNDMDNVRLAWRAAIQGGEATRLRPAMDTLGFYLEWRVHPNEGHVVFQRLANALDPDVCTEARTTLVRGLTWQASFLRQLGQQDAALALLDRAEALADHPDVDESTRLFERAFIAYQRGYCWERRQNNQALACFRRCVELWEAYGDPWWTALGLGGLGYGFSWSNHFIEARDVLARAVEIFERYGHVRELVFLHNRLSDCCGFKGDLEATHVHAERALALAEQSGDRKGKADSLHNLASLMVSTEAERQQAERLSHDAAALYRALGAQFELAVSIAGLGKHRLILGDAEAAQSHFEEARELFKVQQQRQGEGYILRWLAITDATEGRQSSAKERIERSIEIFAEVSADNFISHLQIIHYLTDKQALPACEARPWLAGILRNALDIREFYDVYWSLSALAYVLLLEESAVEDAPLPPTVELAGEIRGFVGNSLEYGRSAYMRALVHDEVDALLRQWPQA